MAVEEVSTALVARVASALLLSSKLQAELISPGVLLGIVLVLFSLLLDLALLALIVKAVLTERHRNFFVFCTLFATVSDGQ